MNIFLPETVSDMDNIMRQVETTINQLVAEEQIVLLQKDNQPKLKVTSPVVINALAVLFNENLEQTSNEVSETTVEQAVEEPTETQAQIINAHTKRKRQLAYGCKRWTHKELENLVELKANLKLPDREVARYIPNRSEKSINSKYLKCSRRNLIQYNESEHKYMFVGPSF